MVLIRINNLNKLINLVKLFSQKISEYEHFLNLNIIFKTISINC